jgi:hypothetical protein
MSGKPYKLIGERALTMFCAEGDKSLSFVASPPMGYALSRWGCGGVHGLPRHG